MTTDTMAMAIEQRLPIPVVLENYRKRLGWRLTAREIREPDDLRLQAWLRVQYWADRVRELSAELDGYWHEDRPDGLVNDFHECLGHWRDELMSIQGRIDLAVAEVNHIRSMRQNAVLEQVA